MLIPRSICRYELIKLCWVESCDKRPSFQELVQRVNSLLEGVAGYLDFSAFSGESQTAVQGYDHLEKSTANKGYDHLEKKADERVASETEQFQDSISRP